MIDLPVLHRGSHLVLAKFEDLGISLKSSTDYMCLYVSYMWLKEPEQGQLNRLLWTYMSSFKIIKTKNYIDYGQGNKHSLSVK